MSERLWMEVTETGELRETIITPFSKNAEQVRALYESSFPFDEKLPWEQLVCDDPSRIMRAYFLEETLTGLSYVFTTGDIAYLGFLAVLPEKRNHHIGTEILNRIEHQYQGCRIILEIERIRDDNDLDGIKQKRKNFYLHRGYEESGLYYQIFNVEYEILIKNGVITADDWKQMAAAHLNNEAVKNIMVTAE